MIPEAPPSSAEPAAEPRPASEPLRECMHFVSLLAEQTEALERQDFARVRELEALRSRLAEEIGGRLEPGTPVLVWIAGQLADALSGVERWIEAEQSAREQISQLQDDSLPLVRGIHRRAAGGSYLSLDAGQTRLDLRL